MLSELSVPLKEASDMFSSNTQGTFRQRKQISQQNYFHTDEQNKRSKCLYNWVCIWLVRVLSARTKTEKDLSNSAQSSVKRRNLFTDG
jgi:hypothetical protein